MAKYDWNTFRNYVEFLAGEMASGTVHPNHDSELISWYHDAFLPWDHYLNNIVLFYHDSPITRSHFMDPTDRAIKGFYCICIISVLRNDTNSNKCLCFNKGISSTMSVTSMSKLPLFLHRSYSCYWSRHAQPEKKETATGKVLFCFRFSNLTNT